MPLVLDPYTEGSVDIDTVYTYIYPDEGYNISAAMFSHDTTLNSAILSITFEDMGTVGTDDNHVKVTIDFHDTYATVGYNTQLSLYIDGDAVDSSLINIVAGILEDAASVALVNDTITFAAESGITHTTQAIVNGSGNIHYFSGTISSDTPTKLAVITVNVDSVYTTSTQSAHLQPAPLLYAATPAYDIGLDKFYLVNIPSSTVVNSLGNTTTLSYELWYEDNINTPFPSIISSGSGANLSDHTASLQVEATLPPPGIITGGDDVITGVTIVPNDGGIVIPIDGEITVDVNGVGGNTTPTDLNDFLDSWQQILGNITWPFGSTTGGTVELEDESGVVVYTEPIIYNPTALEPNVEMEPEDTPPGGPMTGGKATIGGFTDIAAGGASINWIVRVIPNSGEIISTTALGGGSSIDTNGYLVIPFKQVGRPRVTIRPDSQLGSVTGTISTLGSADAEAEAVSAGKDNFTVKNFTFQVESTQDLQLKGAGTINQASFPNSGFNDTVGSEDSGFFQVSNITQSIDVNNEKIGIVTGTIYMNKYSDMDIDSALNMDDYFQYKS